MTTTNVSLGCICGWKREHTCTAWPTLPEMPDSTADISPTARRTAADVDASIVQAILGLPHRLRAHRQAGDLSLREVSRRAGVSATTLHRIELGEADYSVDSLIAVTAYLEGSK